MMDLGEAAEAINRETERMTKEFAIKRSARKINVERACKLMCQLTAGEINGEDFQTRLNEISA